MVEVLGIGNALVDVLVHISNEELERLGVHKGAMRLIDQAETEKLYNQVGPATEISGGSAANTIVGVASFGGKAAYIGKVAADQLGNVFHHDITAQGIMFDTAPDKMGLATGCCIVLVTPDGERTMNTFLGASNALTKADLDTALIQSAQVVYLEGYLFDPPAAQEAFRAAATIAQTAGRQVALTLSDMFCVTRHQVEFQKLIKSHVDILFANEHELCAQYQTKNLQTALQEARRDVKTLIVTQGEDGAIVVSQDNIIRVPARPVSKVVDTTGAGDLFAGGFLFGMTHGKSLAESGHFGAVAASEIISHIGARPQKPLAKLV